MEKETRYASYIVLVLGLVGVLACQVVYRLPEWVGLAGPPPLESGGVLLYEEDFSDNSRGWIEETFSDEEAQITRVVVDGKYRISVTSKKDFYFVITSVPAFLGKDFLLSMDVSVLELDPAPGDLTLQFSLREADGIVGKHYAFQFYSDGTFDGEVWSSASYQSVEEILEKLQNEALVLAPGFSKTYAIQAEGDTFTLYLDGEELVKLTDATIDEAGQISLNLSLDNLGQSVVIEFDNLAIYALP